MESSKELFDYWHNQVQFRNPELISEASHVPTPKLRHECTNYDELRRSSSVQQLEEHDRSLVITVIKYTCTAQVLQKRASYLRRRSHELVEACQEQDQQKSKLLVFIRSLQQKIFGKDNQIKRLEMQVASLEAENEALRTEGENSKVESELQIELEELKKKYSSLEEHRQKLAKNNQSLGGRVSHTNRYRQQRNEARELVKQQNNQITDLLEQNQRLQMENEQLQRQLNQMRKI